VVANNFYLLTSGIPRKISINKTESPIVTLKNLFYAKNLFCIFGVKHFGVKSFGVKSFGVNNLA